jgi:hypothetical protein
MQLSTLFITVCPVLALAVPVTIPRRQFPNQFNPNEDITTAMFNWLQDTGFVSSFLDYATTNFPNPPTDGNLLTNAADALAAEIDETNHKGVLDNFFIFGTNAPNQDVINAYNVLVTQQTFQMVVDKLSDISTTGNLNDVQDINTNRCANVLPAIDVYFQAVATATGSSTVYQAIRPAACGGAFHG